MTVTRADLSSFAATLTRTELPQTPGLQGVGGGTETVQGPGAADFGRHVREAIESVESTQQNAQAAAQAYANGERNDLHGTMIALEQADITFRLVSNLRTRLVEAYREVMRMGG
ncbi:MAG: flagellar hook-basal body complex protein FliE [Sandaracinaceae bacterium]